ncbi:sugar kinase [Ornithinibacillus bavariensis]|uniref:sugar kinase n=1 Tax=Ornithinibacillus bavariensis TaxID=545502 RepID=UPI000EDA4135|nr:sugar kinase [Ornithinibacillus sp.]
MGMKGTIKAFGEVMMRLEAPHYLKLEQTRELKVLYSGTGLNVLSALNKYGYDTSLITKLPSNSLGDAALSYIGSLGVGISDILRGGEYLGMYFLENGFDIRPSRVTYSNRKESSFCTSSIMEYDLNNILKDTALIHLCGITLSISDQTRSNVQYLVKKAKEFGITVVFDFNYRPKLWKNNVQARSYYQSILQHTDICFMTERDAQYILEMETNQVEQEKQIEDLIPKVAEAYDIQVIAGTIRNKLKEGKHTIRGYMFHQHSFYFSRDYSFSSLERIGAGDAFSSGILHGVLSQYLPKDSIEFATAACALAHTTYGDSPVCLEEEIWSLVNRDEVQIER